MADVINTYQNFAKIDDFREQGFSGNWGFTGPARFEHTTSCWSVAGVHQNAWYDYYLVQIMSSLAVPCSGTLKIDHYILSLTFVDDSGKVVPSAKLIAQSPDTTQNSTTYTSSISETLSSSVGFFGESPTASIGGSVTVGNSVSRTINDIEIINRSYSGGDQDATWEFDVAEESNSQSGNLETVIQALYWVPRADTANGANISFTLKAGISDHDNNGTEYFDDITANLLGNLNGQGATLTHYNDRGGDVALKPEIIKLDRPNAPN